jgi:hypothetical protein
LIKVVRRRGFGQIALSEFAPGSIGVFIHRGDSPGESGSNVYFFSDLNSRHEPCGHLFPKLVRGVSDKALVISDGSNVRFNMLKRQCRLNGIDRRIGYESHIEHPFDLGGLRWNCVGP